MSSSERVSSSQRHDALLTWASERGSGRWEEWKDACAALSLEPNEAARNEDALGHVEFDWGESRFAAAPTTLLPIPGVDGLLLLSGARPNGELELLAAIAAEGDFECHFAAPVAQAGGPASIVCDCDLADAERFAQASGIRVEPDPELLVQALPRLSLELAGERRAPDLRFPHALIDPKTLVPRWHEADSEGAEGLWLCYSQRRPEHYLRRDEAWWWLPIREHGVFLVADPEVEPPLLEYEQATWTLHVRSRAPLPPLQARALTLCSGRLPLRRPLARGEQELAYVNVDPASAAAVFASLGLPLREPLQA